MAIPLPQEKIETLRDRVIKEIALARKDDSAHLTTNLEFADQAGVTDRTIIRWLQTALPSHELWFRRARLQEQNGREFYSVSIGSLSPEDRSAYGLLGYEQSLAQLDFQQLSENGKLGAREVSRRRMWNGIRFDSPSEIACAVAFVKYGQMRLVEGETTQLPVGPKPPHGPQKRIDFKPEGIMPGLLEYHEPILFRGGRQKFGDFSSEREYLSFIQRRDQLFGIERRLYVDSVRAELSGRYHGQREVLVQQSPYRGELLTLASSWLEFYKLLAARLSMPDANRFKTEFEATKRAVIEGRLAA